MNLEELEMRIVPTGQSLGHQAALLYEQALLSQYNSELRNDTNWHSNLQVDNTGPGSDPTVTYLLGQMQSSLTRAAQYSGRANADLSAARIFYQEGLYALEAQYLALAMSQINLEAQFLHQAEQFGYEAVLWDLTEDGGNP